MTICSKCGSYIGDLNIGGFGGHICPNSLIPYKPIPYNPSLIHMGEKCGMCGSTAIDHTQNDCERNRGIYMTSPGGKKRSDKSKIKFKKKAG